MLTEEQKQVVSLNSGYSIVCAAAGSGKTRCIATRAMLLAPKSKVLTLCYNAEAAEEIRHRAFITNHSVFTFHALALSILSMGKRIFVADEYRTVLPAIEQAIVETGYQKELLRDSADRKKQLRIIASNLLSDWMYQSEMLMPYTNVDIKLISNKLYQGYPFFQLLAGLGNLCDTNPRLIRKMFEGCNLQIDEAQDCTPLRWKIINTIADSASSVMVVGDPRQSIYSFQGADPELFLKAWHSPKWAQYSLSVNFRCAQSIVEYANELVEGSEYNIGESQRAFRKEAGEVKWVMHPDPANNQILCRTNKICKNVESGRTMHSVKGLEFDNVTINFDGFPSSINDEREETRLHYVAATRAKNKLHLWEGN